MRTKVGLGVYRCDACKVSMINTFLGNEGVTYNKKHKCANNHKVHILKYLLESSVIM